MTNNCHVLELLPGPSNIECLTFFSRVFIYSMYAHINNKIKLRSVLQLLEGGLLKCPCPYLKELSSLTPGPTAEGGPHAQ